MKEVLSQNSVGESCYSLERLEVSFISHTALFHWVNDTITSFTIKKNPTFFHISHIGFKTGEKYVRR